MKRNAFGQLGHAAAPTYHRPFLRYFAPAADEGQGGGGGDGKGEFKPPASQEELDRIVTERANRADRKARDEERARFAEFDAYKADAEKFRAAEAAKAAAGKGGDGKTEPTGVTEGDVDERITKALAAKDLELAIERVGDALDKALEDRTFPASKLLSLDRAQFVKDGKTVDTEKLADWVKDNTKEIPVVEARRRTIPGQGERDANAAGGTVQAGRDLFESEKKPVRKD